MNIICVICSDLLVQSDDVFYTRCSHVFHLQCLTQWLERSKSCPQCREKVAQNKIHRLYFTFSSNNVVESASSPLQERIDSLKFQMLLKEKDIKYYMSKNVTLEKQNAGLRKEVRKVESEINQKNSAIHAFQEQITYFKKQSQECNTLKNQITRLKNKIEELRPIQVLLHDPLKDVHEMVGKTRNPDTLITYISVIKKELLATLNKCKQLRMTIKRLQEDLAKTTIECDSLMEEESKRMHLQEDLVFSESKNLSLQKRVQELEEILGIAEKSHTNLEQRKAERKNEPSGSSTIECITKADDEKEEKTCRSSTLSRHRNEKASVRNSRSMEGRDLNLEIENTELTLTGSEESIIKYSTVSNSSRAPKRPRITTVCKASGDTNNLNKSKSDSKYTDPDIHCKTKKKRDTLVHSRKEKYDNRNKDSSHVIDLT